MLTKTVFNYNLGCMQQSVQFVDCLWIVEIPRLKSSVRKIFILQEKLFWSMKGLPERLHCAPYSWYSPLKVWRTGKGCSNTHCVLFLLPGTWKENRVTAIPSTRQPVSASNHRWSGNGRGDVDHGCVFDLLLLYVAECWLHRVRGQREASCGGQTAYDL